MRDTIKKHEHFVMGDNDPIARSAGFVVRAKKTLFPDDARYGLIASKRTFKLAVDRNRAKRLLREWIRHNEKMLLPDLDYVFIARRAILEHGRDQGIAAMTKALHWIAKSNKNAQ